MNPGSKPHKGRRRKARAPRRTTRPQFLTLAALLVVASLVGGYMVLNRATDTAPTASSAGSGNKGSTKNSAPRWDGKTKVIGDGSTSYTGPQKGRLKAVPLKKGEKPPQFVVFSWDGALAGDDNLFQHYREMAKKYDAHMTFFLTGIYLLPKEKRDLYDPPQHDKGAAAISYPTDEHVRTTLEQLGKAWKEGNEIGTHFNGHFCGEKGGNDWSVAEWKQEIKEFNSFVANWKTNTGDTDLDPLPFSVDAIKGGRALPGGPGQPPEGRQGLRLPLRRQLPGRLPGVARQEERHLGLPAADAPVQRRVPGAVDGLQLPLQPVGGPDRG